MNDLKIDRDEWRKVAMQFRSDLLERVAKNEKLDKQVRTLEAALQAIVEWRLPPTGMFHEDGTEKSYSYCYGSNGEREYIRRLAATAIEKARGFK